MRLAGLVLIAVACSGSSGDRAPSPATATAPAMTDEEAMKLWKELKIRGRDFEEMLAAIPAELRRPMAMAFLRDGNVQCPSVAMDLPCGGTESRFPAVLPSHALDEPCLRRLIALWALDQLDGTTIATELPDVAAKLAAIRPPETELPRMVIEKVDDPTVLARLIGVANLAGHEALADQAVVRVPKELLTDLACEYGVDAAYETLFQDRGASFPKRCLGGHPLRRDTGLRLIEQLRSKGVENLTEDDLDQMTAFTLMRDCVTYVAGRDIFERVVPGPLRTIRRGWNDDACIALRGEGASSSALRELISPNGLRVDRYSDHPNDDDEDRIWSEKKKNDATFRMPFADELEEVLPDCAGNECPVPGTTILFRFQLTPDGEQLEVIERYERLGGC